MEWVASDRCDSYVRHDSQLLVATGRAEYVHRDDIRWGTLVCYRQRAGHHAVTDARPDVTDSIPEPDVTDSIPEPDVTDSDAEPDVTDSDADNASTGSVAAQLQGCALRGSHQLADA